MGSIRSGVIAGAGSALLLAGCAEGDQRSAIEVKRSYAEQFTRGIDFGLAGHIRASGYDPETYDLEDVRLDDAQERIVHASRAEMIVNTQRDTIMLRFVGVTAAAPDVGRIVELEGLSTAEVPLGFDVVP